MEDLKELITQDPRYSELGHSIDENCRKVQDMIPQEQQAEFWHCFDTINNANNEMEGITGRIAYLQGLRDGVKLRDILKIE